MKYRNLYLKELEKNRAKAMDVGEPDGDFSDEWMIIAVALKYPRYDISYLRQKIEEEFGKKLSEAELDRSLRRVNLATAGKRVFRSKETIDYVMIFRKLIGGDEEAIYQAQEVLDKLLDSYDDRNKKTFPAKYMLCYMLIYDKELWCNESCRVIVKNFKEVLCRKTIEKIFQVVAEKMDPDIDVSISGVTTKTIDDAINRLNRIKDMDVDIDNSADKDKQIESLKFNVTNLKVALDIATENLNELKDSLKEAEHETKIRTIAEFYKGLNSKEYGNILDNLVYAKTILNDLRKSNFELDSKIKTITIILKLIIRFIQSSKMEPILPIEDIGKVIEVIDAELAEYDYEGSMFKEGEKKTVEIISPGWRYGEEVIISNPIVREV